MIFFKSIMLVLAVFSPGIFAGSETALTSLSGMDLKSLKEKYPHWKLFLDFWTNFPDKVLTTIVLGNTCCTVICGVLAATLGLDVAKVLDLPAIGFIPFFTFGVTLFVLLFGEVLPKILGRKHFRGIAPWVLLFLVPMTKFLGPLVKILVGIARIFTRFLGIEKGSEVPTLSAQEFKGMLEEAKDSTLKTQRHLLKNIMEFGRLRVFEVKKDISRLVAIEMKSSSAQVLEIVRRAPYSRIPVYDGSLDNIMGIIYSRDLLTVWRTHGLVLISDILRPVYSVSEEMKISTLLKEFRKGHHHFALVRNLQAQVTGLITIEDVLEEIVGEVYDEYRLV